MPALMAMVSKWAPRTERGRMGAIIFGGAQIGNIGGSYFSGLIMHEGSWENVFYLFGSLGLIWFVLWVSVNVLLLKYTCLIKLTMRIFLFKSFPKGKENN